MRGILGGREAGPHGQLVPSVSGLQAVWVPGCQEMLTAVSLGQRERLWLAGQQRLSRWVP